MNTEQKMSELRSAGYEFIMGKNWKHLGEFEEAIKDPAFAEEYKREVDLCYERYQQVKQYD